MTRLGGPGAVLRSGGLLGPVCIAHRSMSGPGHSKVVSCEFQPCIHLR